MGKIDYTELQNKVVKQANEGLTKKEVKSIVAKLDEAKVEKSTLIQTALRFFQK